MTDFTNAIELNGINKNYDGFRLENISLTVPKGSIMGFIGQNGAGKTTTIRLMLGITRPDSGNIKLLGKDIYESEREIKNDISAVFDEMPFHDNLNALNIEKILRPLYKNWDSSVYHSYLDRFCLPKKKAVGKFSKGMKMKLQIAAALSHKAKLLILDEATTGLDPIVRSEILDIFLEFLQDENNSVFLSSHITSDLEKIADSITFIDKGKILLTGYKDDILENHAIIKCSAADFEKIDKNDIISSRTTDFGVDAMCFDRAACISKYRNMVFDQPSLDDIMLFYVNRNTKEWS